MPTLIWRRFGRKNGVLSMFWKDLMQYGKELPACGFRFLPAVAARREVSAFRQVADKEPSSKSTDLGLIGSEPMRA